MYPIRGTIPALPAPKRVGPGWHAGGGVPALSHDPPGSPARNEPIRHALGLQDMQPRKERQYDIRGGSHEDSVKPSWINSNSSSAARRSSTISAAITSGAARLAESSRLSSRSQKRS